LNLSKIGSHCRKRRVGGSFLFVSGSLQLTVLAMLVEMIFLIGVIEYFGLRKSQTPS